LGVADFSIAVSPASVTVVEGTTATYNVTVQGTAGWTDQVASACTISPQIPNGPYCNGVGGSLPGTYPVIVGTSNISPADFTIQFSGSADGITHQAAPVTLHIQNAVGAVSPTSAQIPVGSSAPFNVSVTSQNGLTDQFTFSCPGLPAGMSCNFSPPSGTLPANGTLTTTLTINVNSRPAAFHGLSSNAVPPPRTILLLAQLGMVFLTFLFLLHMHRSIRSTATLSASAGGFVLFLASLVVGAIACGGGGAAPPAPPPVPTVSLQANPATITVGSSTTLTWTSTNATQLSISPGVGSVSPQGSTVVQPTSSTTYTISASGPGGSASASAPVTVSPTRPVVVTVQATSPSGTVTPGSVTITIP